MANPDTHSKDDHGHGGRHEPARQRICQQNVGGVQDEIDRMISLGLIAVSEKCVVEQIGERCEGTIETGFSSRPPVSVSENLAEIFRRSIPDAWVVEN